MTPSDAPRSPGIDVPDTRASTLEQHRGAHAVVVAFHVLAWTSVIWPRHAPVAISWLRSEMTP